MSSIPQQLQAVSRRRLGCPVVPLFPFYWVLIPYRKPLQTKKGALCSPRLLGNPGELQGPVFQGVLGHCLGAEVRHLRSGVLCAQAPVVFGFGTAPTGRLTKKKQEAACGPKRPDNAALVQLDQLCGGGALKNRGVLQFLVAHEARLVIPTRFRSWSSRCGTGPS